MGEHTERALAQQIETLKGFLLRVAREAGEPHLRAMASTYAAGAESILIVAGLAQDARRAVADRFVAAPALAPAAAPATLPLLVVSSAQLARDPMDTEDRYQASEVYGETFLDFGEYPRCRKNPNGDDLGCYFTAADDHRRCIYCGGPD
jgi:hypothetical protein